MNNLIKSHLYPYVIAGGAALDRQCSGWYDGFTHKELTQLLDMNTHCDDVLGILEAKGYTHSLSHYDTAIGMSIDDGCRDEEYAQLTAAWRDYIRLRQHLPTVPEGCVFIGAGGLITPPRPRVDAHTAYYGDEDWNHIDNANMDGCDLYYCVNVDYAEIYISALKEYHMTDKTVETSLALIPDDGVNYKGYDLTEDDIDKLMEFVGYTTTLRDAGFSVEINAVSVGCMTFTRAQLCELHERYTELQLQRDEGFTVTMGNRVEFLPAGQVFIVAATGATEYQLVSLSSGNRWNNEVVKSPEDCGAIPFKDFLTNQQDIDQWRKV